MSKNRSDQVITLSKVNSLNNQDSVRKPIDWKDFGLYLDGKLEPLTSKETKNNSTSGPFTDNCYLAPSIKYKICNSCNRPVGEKILESHYLKCKEMKQKKSREPGSTTNNLVVKKKRGRVPGSSVEADDTSVDSSRNTSPLKGTPTPTSNISRPKKKYKKNKEDKNSFNDSSLSAGSENGKKKKAGKPKTTAKPKGPVDVEKQCGVPLPSGGFCARSLTCKTHSMGAKRAVMGRSAPYDVLLQQYQKRNQAKLAANNALAAQRRENAAFHENGSSMSEHMNGGSYSKMLDPDEETHLVLEGLSKNNPAPLEEKVIVPTRYRHRFLSMREFYADSLITSGGNTQNVHDSTQSNDQTLANQAISGSIGGLQGRCALVNVDSRSDSTQAIASVPGEMYQVRAPSKAVLLTAQYNAMQQQMFQQQIVKLQQQQMLILRQRQAAAAAQQEKAKVQLKQQ